MPVLFSEVLRGLIVDALRAANTMAGQRVYSPRDWPITGADMPAILVDDQREESEGRGAIGFPAFHTTAIFQIDVRVEGLTETAVKADLATLRAQIKAAILTSYDIVRQVEQVVGVRTEARVSGESRKHVGEMRLEFAFRYPEDFEPMVTDALEGIDIHADMAAPFDATGAYPDPAFPDAVQPTPRESGPDGRDEGGLTITLPT